MVSSADLFGRKGRSTPSSPPPAEELIIMSLRRRQARAGDKVEVVKEGGDTGTLISGQGEV